MAKKILPLVSVVILSIFTVLFLTGTNSSNNEIFEKSFFIDATYYSEDQYVEIIFKDKTEKTSRVVLEILGMPESFQKTFDTYEFNQHVSFLEVPKYGWSIHPIVLQINHPEFGKIELKTEIHSQGESKPPVIYSS